MAEILPTNEKQLSDFEFQCLVNVGSPIVESMIFNRIRLFEEDYGSDIIDGALNYAMINSRGIYYVKRGYQNACVYFADHIDHENFSNMIQNYSQK